MLKYAKYITGLVESNRNVGKHNIEERERGVQKARFDNTDLLRKGYKHSQEIFSEKQHCRDPYPHPTPRNTSKLCTRMKFKMAMSGAVRDGSNQKIITPCVAYLEVPLERKKKAKKKKRKRCARILPRLRICIPEKILLTVLKQLVGTAVIFKSFFSLYCVFLSMLHEMGVENLCYHMQLPVEFLSKDFVSRRGQ